MVGVTLFKTVYKIVPFHSYQVSSHFNQRISLITRENVRKSFSVGESFGAPQYFKKRDEITKIFQNL